MYATLYGYERRYAEGLLRQLRQTVKDPDKGSFYIHSYATANGTTFCCLNISSKSAHSCMRGVLFLGFGARLSPRRTSSSSWWAKAASITSGLKPRSFRIVLAEE